MAKRRIAIVCGKVCEAPEGDYFVTCSFDPNHVLLRSRMPYHIIKCKKQHPNHNKIQCPYDATEYIDEELYNDHIENCPSKRSFVDEKYETAMLKEKGLLCNIQPTPYIHAGLPEVDEDWGGTVVNGNDKTIAKGNDEDIAKANGEDVTNGDDEDETIFDNLKGVGRGIGLSKKLIPKKGVGRAESLRRILGIDTLSLSSHSSNSSCSSNKNNSPREYVSTGQFDDY